MKFIKKIGDGAVTIKDNEVIDTNATEKAEIWGDEFSRHTQQVVMPLKIQIYTRYLLADLKKSAYRIVVCNTHFAAISKVRNKFVLTLLVTIW